MSLEIDDARRDDGAGVVELMQDRVDLRRQRLVRTRRRSCGMMPCDAGVQPVPMAWQ
jgi:hypothetical protein